MDYWTDQPGVGVNIVDKLLNYTILTPASVIEWALGDSSTGGKLAQSWIFEMVSATVQKVTNRVRQIVAARDAPGLPAEQKTLLNETLIRETGSMRDIFKIMDAFLVGWEGKAEGEDQEVVARWASRWLRVFRRKSVVEDAFLVEAENYAANAVALNGEVEEANGNGHQMDIEADV